MIRFFNFTNHPLDKGRYCALGRRAEMKHIMKISPEGENVIFELNAESLIQSWEAVNQSGFPHQTVIPQNSGRAAILSRLYSRN